MQPGEPVGCCSRGRYAVASLPSSRGLTRSTFGHTSGCGPPSSSAQHVIVMKRSMANGFAGIENDLFYCDNTSMLFGDARETLEGLITEIKQEISVAL
jgi:hypothetical protein